MHMDPPIMTRFRVFVTAPWYVGPGLRACLCPFCGREAQPGQDFAIILSTYASRV